MKEQLTKMYLAFFARIILMIGGLNYLYMGIANVKTTFLFLNNPRFIFIIIGISALYLFFNRDYYLPFLGETVVPIIKQKIDSKNLLSTTIKNVPPNATVIYWAAKPEIENADNIIKNPYIAYSDYSNSGISIANENGEAIIQYECPSKYKVGKFIKNTLEKHIHYRYMDPIFPGVLSPVKTLFLNENCM